MLSSTKTESIKVVINKNMELILTIPSNMSRPNTDLVNMPEIELYESGICKNSYYCFKNNKNWEKMETYFRESKIKEIVELMRQSGRTANAIAEMIDSAEATTYKLSDNQQKLEDRSNNDEKTEMPTFLKSALAITSKRGHTLIEKSEFSTSKVLRSDSLLSDYKECHEFVYKEIFSLGAPNRTGDTVETMDKRLLAINYFSRDIEYLFQFNSYLEFMAVDSLIAKVFNLGNCQRQAFALFMHMLVGNHINEGFEIIYIKGNGELNDHYLVVADRNQEGNLHDLSTWGNAVSLDTWSNTILSGKDLTLLTKEQFAEKGNVSGEVKLECRYRREEGLSTTECNDLIVCLQKAKSRLKASTLEFLRNKYQQNAIDLYLLLADYSDSQSLVNKIHDQIDKDIAMYQAIVTKNNKSNSNSANTKTNETLFDDYNMINTIDLSSIDTHVGLTRESKVSTNNYLTIKGSIFGLMSSIIMFEYFIDLIRKMRMQDLSNVASHDRLTPHGNLMSRCIRKTIDPLCLYPMKKCFSDLNRNHASTSIISFSIFSNNEIIKAHIKSLDAEKMLGNPQAQQLLDKNYGVVLRKRKK